VQIANKCVSYELAAPVAVSMPEFFRQNGYKNPTLEEHSPMKLLRGDSQFPWLKKNPKTETRFAVYMSARRSGMPNWFDIYPVKKNILDLYDVKQGRALLVDVGGNKGHDLEKFREAFPGAEGELVLQDQQNVIPEHVEGVSVHAYDFFTAQPVKGKSYGITNERLNS
jgi:hypothetical protein